MKHALIIDINRCSICYSCQVACKDEFVGNTYPPYSHIQTDREPAWIKVSEPEQGKYPYVKVYPTPVLCMLCEKAPCIDACPIPDCIYKTDRGVVIIDPAKCNGCKSCIDACPYNVIVFNNDRNICQKCTLCHHRLDKGQEPACIDACPSGVFFFGEEAEVTKQVKKRGAKVMHPEYKTEPGVYYVGLQTVSLAGHLVDAVTLMDLPGADVTVEDTNTGSIISTRTNVSGNFLAENLKLENTYDVKIEYKAHVSKTINAVYVDMEYKHLGDIKLNKIS